MATIDQIQIPNGTYDMSVKDEYISWGGPNKESSYGCIDAALVGHLRANRLACIAGSAITVEYSRDAGSTWTDYGLTNAQKGAIFTQGSGVVIGKADSTNKATANGNKYQLRITINVATAPLYTQLLKTVIYCSTNGSYHSKCQIQGVLRGSSTFTNITDAIAISGWSGYNVINHDFTAGSNYNGQYTKVRYLFTANGGDTKYNGLQIVRIMGFGGVGWNVPSTIALTDHLYTYDQDQNANFPGKVLATGGFTGDLAGNATTATTATKLGTTTVGGTTTPVYLNAGVPTALAYTIAKSVPSDAKFTDTTYTSQAAASGGTAVSLVTTGEKYTWNNKSNLAIGTTATTAAAGNHTHATSIAASSGTNQLTLAASTKYALTAGGTSYIFTTPPNTTYESKAAASGGTEVSLVTTGEKYTWNNKSNLTIGTTSTTAAAGNHTHKYAGSATAGGPATTLAGTYSGSGGQLAPNTVSGGNVKAVMMNNPKGITGFNTYCDCLLMDTYTGSDVPIVTGIGLSKKGTSSAADTIPRAYIFNGIKGNTTTWANMAEVVTTKNIKTATVGSASAGTAIAADDITAWSAGTAPSLTITSVACDDITAWSAGTLPTLGTAIPADDITAWSAGSLPSLTYNSTNHSLTFSQGSLPSLSYTAKSIPNVTGVGTLPSLSYTARSVGSASNWSAGTVPSLSYTARSIPNISVTSTTVATGGIN